VTTDSSDKPGLVFWFIAALFLAAAVVIWTCQKTDPFKTKTETLPLDPIVTYNGYSNIRAVLGGQADRL